MIQQVERTHLIWTHLILNLISREGKRFIELSALQFDSFTVRYQ